MKVLSLDIDFFVDPIHTFGSLSGKRRLLSDDYHVDSEKMVDRFLQGRCGLRTTNPVRGIQIREHVDAFFILRELVEQGSEQIELIHIDAHADLGLGDVGYVYLLTDLLHRTRSRRQRPRKAYRKLNSGNWVAFAAAAGWLKSLVFVPREYPPTDLMPYYFEDFAAREQRSRKFRLYAIPEDRMNALMAVRNPTKVVSTPPAESVEYKCVRRSRFRLETPPDFMIVCQSPSFTPKEADRVLGQCSAFMAIAQLSTAVGPPI